MGIGRFWISTFLSLLVAVPPSAICQTSTNDTFQVELAVARYQAGRLGTRRFGFDPAPWNFLTAGPTDSLTRSPDVIHELAAALSADVVDIGKATLCRRAEDRGCFHLVVGIGPAEVRGDTATASLYTYELIEAGDMAEENALHLLLARTGSSWKVVRFLDLTRSYLGKGRPFSPRPVKRPAV